MVEVARETYRRLMTAVEELEDRLETRRADDQTTAGEIDKLVEELRLKRNELARVSDGCGRPHHHLR